MKKEQLAFFGGAPQIRKSFPWPLVGQAEIDAVNKVLESGIWGISDNPDNAVSRFEKKFAGYMGVKHAVTTVNGSVALRLALLASGVRAGDEVIVPPVTFIATASVVVEINCIPVFVDIEPDTFNLDPGKLEDAITSRTKAIIPVHFAGLACDMDRIMEIAAKHRLVVIEDACHAHGAEYKGKKLGSIGHAGCFSFQSSKNMASGEGGIVITNDDSIFSLADSLHNVGRKTGGAWYEHYNLGCNYRMTQLQAAILEVQLMRLESEVNRRNENGLYLDILLKDIDGITPLKRGDGITKHSYHLYAFRYDKTKFANNTKAEFAAMLSAEGVPCFMGYPIPLHQQEVFQDKRFFSYMIPESVNYRNVHLPVSERICYEEGMWILQQALLGEKEDMEDIAKAILKIRDCL